MRRRSHTTTRRHRRRHRTRARRRRNPFLAEYLLGNPRHRRRRTVRSRRRHSYRRHRRRNPSFGGAMVRQLTGNPMRYVMIGGMGAFGMYGTVTGGNWLVAQVAPTYLAGDDWTSRAVRYGSRIAAAAGIDMGLGLVVRSSELRMAFRAGAGIAIVGGMILDVMGKGFLLGAADQYAMPQSLLGGYTRAALPGSAMSGYSRMRMPGSSFIGARSSVPTGLSRVTAW